MPTLPGTDLILVHADLAFASFEARFNAGARLDHARQLHQRRLFECQRLRETVEQLAM
jgi:hypothetical protein